MAVLYLLDKKQTNIYMYICINKDYFITYLMIRKHDYILY